jgi:hypothetical protein
VVTGSIEPGFSIEPQNPGLYCSILLVDSEQDHVSVGAGPSLPREYNDAVEGLKIGPLNKK